jgi:hypothetical protein
MFIVVLCGTYELHFFNDTALQKDCTIHECSWSAEWILLAYWHNLRSFCNKLWLTSVLVLATRWLAALTQPQCQRANPCIFLCPRTQKLYLTVLEILLRCSRRSCSSSLSHIWSLGRTYVVLYHNILSISYCAILNSSVYMLHLMNWLKNAKTVYICRL